jgi:CBS domain-containing protein
MSELLRSGAAVRLGHGRDHAHRLGRLRVRRLMRPPPMAVDPEMTVAEVIERMTLAERDWLPVLEQGRLVGVVTLRDLEQVLALRGAAPRVSED